MQGQISIFDGSQPFRIDKPIRLIELFAGYGSQALALKYLGVSFEHWRICEWAINSIQAYKDLHFENDKTDYSAELTKEEVFAQLARLGISSDYEKPMSLTQIRRLGEKKARKVFNNIKATRNLVSVTNVTAEQLGITETDKYCYIMTYSFPCQDLSNAGLTKGMEKDSGTRSSLLWEVARLLQECEELPQVLIMENVPEVIGKRNIQSFAEWIKILDDLGYKSKWNLLNATEYEVPQNRKRCFMVSVWGDYYYEFPQAKGCNKMLKDILEKQVDERYYLKGNIVLELIKHKDRNKARGNGFGWKPLKISGGGTPELSRQRAAGGTILTLLLKNQATEIYKFCDNAVTLMARDNKGFGNQPMSAVMEISKNEVNTGRRHNDRQE